MPKPLDRCSDAELLTLTSEFPHAFGKFYDRHSHAVTAYLVARTGSAETALDLTSEVFEAALRGRGTFDPDRGPARFWLYGIARNKAARSFRQRAVDRAVRMRLRVPALHYTDGALEEVERVVDASRSDLLRDLELLPEAERAAIVARVVDERSYREIAEATATGEAAIRQRVSRGLARLRTSWRARP